MFEPNNLMEVIFVVLCWEVGFFLSNLYSVLLSQADIKFLLGTERHICLHKTRARCHMAKPQLSFPAHPCVSNVWESMYPCGVFTWSAG